MTSKWESRKTPLERGRNTMQRERRKNNEKLLIFIDRASRYLQTVKDRLNNDRNQNSQTV